MSMKEIKQSVEEVVEDLDSFRIVLRASVTHESTRAKLLKELEELQKNVTQALTDLITHIQENIKAIENPKIQKLNDHVHNPQLLKESAVLGAEDQNKIIEEIEK